MRFQTDQKYIRKELSEIRDDGFNKIYKKSLKNLKALSSVENRGNKIYENSKYLNHLLLGSSNLIVLYGYKKSFI